MFDHRWLVGWSWVSAFGGNDFQLKGKILSEGKTKNVGICFITFV